MQIEIRRNSAVLSTYPWMTDFLVQSPDSAITNPAFSPFFDTLHNMERQLYMGSHTLEAMDLHEAMVIVDPNNITIPKSLTTTPLTAKRLASIFVAYNLVDILYALESPIPSTKNPQHGRLPVTGLLPSDKIWPINDWVEVIGTCQTCMNDLERFRQRPTFPPSQELDTGSGNDLSLQAVLYKGMYSLNKQTKGSIMLFNLQSAAFHLSFMLRGFQMTEKLAIPNIPDCGDVLLNGTIQKQAELSPEEAAHLKRMFDVKELAKLRHPLQGALLYSPLYLLSSRKLAGNHWDQIRMLQLSKAFGNQKPELLRRTELSLWRALLSVATGETTIYPAMLQFLEEIPQNELAGLRFEDREFYCIGRTEKGSSTGDIPLTNFLLNTVQETRVSSDWPLSAIRSAGDRYPTPGPVIPDDNNMLVDSDTPVMPSATNVETPVAEGGDNAMEDKDAEGDVDVESDTRRPRKRSRLPSEERDAEGGRDGDMDVDEDERQKKSGKQPEAAEEEAESESDTPKQPTRSSSRLQGKKAEGKAKSTAGGSSGRSTGKSKRRGGNNSPKAVKILPFLQLRDGAYLQAVDVEDYTHEDPITFDPAIDRVRLKGAEVTFVDPCGAPHRWTPEFHFQEDLDKFQAFKEMVDRGKGLNGMPRYLDPRSQSSVQVIPYTIYQTLTTTQVQDKLHLQHLVITGVPQDRGPIHFDEAGLQELTHLDSTIPIQDQSIPVESDLTAQLCFGTLEHILAMARDPNGAIINGLSFPLPLSAIERDKLSGDAEAWRLTEGLPFCTYKVFYPTGDVRWGLASTAGSRHWPHIDSDGMATIVDMRTGKKWWILFRPHLDNQADAGAHIDVFLNDFDTSVAVKTWDAEAVLLTPGTRLIMKPNTPHAVFTPEHSIAVGGHFYSFGNLQDSVIGIFHCFAVDNIITNTEHPDTRVLLFRMMEYLYKFYVRGADPKKNNAEHLPDLTHFVSLVNVMALCNFCVLANVLDYNTYQFPLGKKVKPLPHDYRLRARFDYNALTPVQRRHFTYIRGLAINFMFWADTQFSLKSKDGVPNTEVSITGIWLPYLAQHAFTLLNYKQKAEKQSVRGIQNCKAAEVKRQMELLFLENSWVENITFEDVSHCDTFAFEDYEWQVTKKARPQRFKEQDPYLLGLTQGDQMFIDGTRSAFRDTKDVELSPEMVPDQDLEEEEPVVSKREERGKKAVPDPARGEKRKRP